MQIVLFDKVHVKRDLNVLKLRLFVHVSTCPNNFHVIPTNPGEMFGCDMAEIKENQHLVIVDYKSCCIFKRSSIVDVLKSVFCDILLINL